MKVDFKQRYPEEVAMEGSTSTAASRGASEDHDGKVWWCDRPPYCQHGWELNHGDIGQSSFCPRCYEFRPVHVPPEEFGNHARHAFVYVMWKEIFGRWRMRCLSDAHDGMVEARLKILKQADKVNDLALRAPKAVHSYVRMLVRNMILDAQWTGTKRRAAQDHQFHARMVPFAFTGENDQGDEVEWECISRGSANLDGSHHAARSYKSSGSDGSTAEWADPIVTRMTVQEALEVLSPSHRTAFELLDYGEKLGTIATRLGVSKKTVRRRLIDIANITGGREIVKGGEGL